jgi:hypothetical protein
MEKICPLGKRLAFQVPFSLQVNSPNSPENAQKQWVDLRPKEWPMVC